MLSAAFSRFALMCDFCEETLFCQLHTYLLAYFYKIQLKRYKIYFISHLFSLGRLRADSNLRFER